jgi:hypothetical protein
MQPASTGGREKARAKADTRAKMCEANRTLKAAYCWRHVLGLLDSRFKRAARKS